MDAVVNHAAEDPAFREARGKLSLGFFYADADAFRSVVQQDHAFFKQLIPKIGLNLLPTSRLCGPG